MPPPASISVDRRAGTRRSSGLAEQHIELREQTAERVTLAAFRLSQVIDAGCSSPELREVRDALAHVEREVHQARKLHALFFEALGVELEALRTRT